MHVVGKVLENLKNLLIMFEVSQLKCVFLLPGGRSRKEEENFIDPTLRKFTRSLKDPPTLKAGHTATSWWQEALRAVSQGQDQNPIISFACANILGSIKKQTERRGMMEVWRLLKLIRL